MEEGIALLFEGSAEGEAGCALGCLWGVRHGLLLSAAFRGQG